MYQMLFCWLTFIKLSIFDIRKIITNTVLLYFKVWITIIKKKMIVTEWLILFYV
jgi:hypothetical protein